MNNVSGPGEWWKNDTGEWRRDERTLLVVGV